ncbi:MULTISPECIES: tryptophan synthase subunit beta like protein [Halomonadaceae]|uniref:tryptophan synthase subunit beta like protein n=1 Tax=Halomonadaceae TaxID=28256 RepID=UPI0015988573|nr:MULTISPECIES: tryptophan synthase subunit beta like protein [Halomonas]QJQ96516.1 tryptophan synthase subunit beta like protein [Halomonas sp. PA5]
MYIKRDATGRIEQVRREPTPECNEYIAPGSIELEHFVNHGLQPEQGALKSSDAEFVRVLEDVIEVLVAKGIIGYLDLPEAARTKLMTRQSLRKRVNDVGLMGEEEQGII